MLRDRLVCGVRDPQLQKRLLAKHQLTFSKSLDMAFECAEKCSRDIHSQSSPPLPVSVNSVGKEVSSTSLASVSCHHCSARHYTSDRKFKSVVCNNCGKLGNLAKVCHSKPNGQQGSKNGTFRGKRKASAYSAQFLKNKRASSERGSQVHALFNVGSKPGKPFCVTVLVNGIELSMEIDTGAAVSVISEGTFKSIWPGSSKP